MAIFRPSRCPVSAYCFLDLLGVVVDQAREADRRRADIMKLSSFPTPDLLTRAVQDQPITPMTGTMPIAVSRAWSWYRRGSRREGGGLDEESARDLSAGVSVQRSAG